MFIGVTILSGNDNNATFKSMLSKKIDTYSRWFKALQCFDQFMKAYNV